MSVPSGVTPLVREGSDWTEAEPGVVVVTGDPLSVLSQLMTDGLVKGFASIG